MVGSKHSSAFFDYIALLRRQRIPLLILATSAILPMFANALDAKTTFAGFSGTISAPPKLAGEITPGDRLIIKIYYPEGGIVKDAKYQILPSFALPLRFSIGPTIDMAGGTKFQKYVIEIFTDRDNNILSIVPGELSGGPFGPLPLGSVNLRLAFERLR